MKLKLVFIGDIPLFFPEKNVARQLKVELWLDLHMILEELKLSFIEAAFRKQRKHMNYIV
ncbi:MAG: hypothetical protein DRP02_11895 [Candidatus Gerdarchaeota archaeon]|nr:MAG: hypothetical protein DRP02_11895 [Candidatus Gerdarchaeota archaeon]